MLRDKHSFQAVFFFLAWVLCGAFLGGACTRAGSPGQPPATAPPPLTSIPATLSLERPTATATVLVTAVSDQPAAGICAGPADGDLTGVEIYPDIPAPRCLRVTGSQQLQVTNRTDSTLEIDLGPYHGTVAPGETYVFTTPLGMFLAPGTHRVRSSPYFGPELWLEE